MKITLIGPVYPYRGGIAHFTTLLALKLKEAGHEVQVVSFKNQYPKWLYPGKSDKDESEGRLKVEATYSLSPINPLDWRKTFLVIKDFQPDLALFQWWVTFWGPAYRYLLKRLEKENVQTMALVHNTIPHEKHFMDEYLAQTTLKWTSRHIVMTDKEKSRLQAVLGNVDNITLVPHPIYRLFTPSGMTKDQILLELGVPQGKIILLFFGFVRPYKGLDILLESLSILKIRGVEIHLLVVGEFWDDREKYDRLIHKFNIVQNVHLFDSYVPDSEAAKFFEVADVFVAPYQRGTQSGVIKLALGYGLPMVVTNVISDGLLQQLPEICTIVQTGDPSTLANAIVNASKKSKFSADRVEELFSYSWRLLIQGITETGQPIQ